MRLGRLKENSNAYPEAMTDEPSRDVSEKRAKNTTTFAAPCAVQGAIAFVRAPESANGLRLVRLLRLTAPARFRHGILVYGLSDATISRLKTDETLSVAIEKLLSVDSMVSLQKRRLSTTVSNTRSKEHKSVVRFNLKIMAQRLEILADGPFNAEAGKTRLEMPYDILVAVSALAFGLSLGFAEPTIEPLSIGLYGLIFSVVLAAAMLLYVVPVSLRKHALGGVIAPAAIAYTLAFSTSLGPTIAMIGNTTLGKHILPAHRLVLAGTVHISHGKSRSCWLYLDAPSAIISPDMLMKSLPVNCGEFHYEENLKSLAYEVKINPGLLGVPFVQSIHVLDAP